MKITFGRVKMLCPEKKLKNEPNYYVEVKNGNERGHADFVLSNI